MPAGSGDYVSFADVPAALGDHLGTTPSTTLNTLLTVRDGAGSLALDRAVAGALLRRLLAGVELPHGARLHHDGDQFYEQWNGRVLCRTADGIAVGGLDWRMVNTRADPDAPDVTWVEVTPRWRRRGIATALLAAASYEAGELLAPTLASAAGAAWGPVARGRVVAVGLDGTELQLLRQTVGDLVGHRRLPFRVCASHQDRQGQRVAGPPSTRGSTWS